MEIVNLLVGGGVLAQGLATLKWVIRVETRLAVVETKLGD